MNNQFFVDLNDDIKKCIEAHGDRLTTLETQFDGRTYDFRKQQRLNLKIFVCSGFMETYLDEQSDLVARIQDQSATKLAIQILDSKTVVKNPVLHYTKGGAIPPGHATKKVSAPRS